MLLKLTGIWTVIGNNRIVLDVNGIGFGVYCVTNDINNLNTNKQKEVTLWVESVFIKDSINIYGFNDNKLLYLFNMLRSVTGIGAKLALQILDTYVYADLISAIQQKDVKLLSAIKGLGSKMATRLVHELQDRIENEAGQIKFTEIRNPQDDDTIEALIALGYNRMRAWKVVQKIKSQINTEKKDNLKVEDMIKHALLYLQGNK